MSAARREEGGIPRFRGPLAPGRHGATAEETWPGANSAKLETLRRNSLQRRAGSRGLELRHSDYGYALIDAARKRIGERSDMTLEEVESWLERT